MNRSLTARYREVHGTRASNGGKGIAGRRVRPDAEVGPERRQTESPGRRGAKTREGEDVAWLPQIWIRSIHRLLAAEPEFAPDPVTKVVRRLPRNGIASGRLSARGCAAPRLESGEAAGR